ncbi:MAG: PLP-dependent aspartate aminotransferase family protein [Kofleriaceae bacterium]
MKPETIAAHGGGTRDPHLGDVAPPIHMATTYARDAAYQLIDGRDYTRDKNPTQLAVEHTLAQLEGGEAALVNASGMAAITSVFRAWLRPGDHAIIPRVGYFAVRKWALEWFPRWNVGLDVVDLTNLDAVRAAVRKETKLIWAETPANPMWDVCDLAALAQIAHGAGARLAVDSTCATPVHTRPIALGADLVMHSATKYLAGHSDVLAGALVTAKRDDHWHALEEMRHMEGAMLGPMEAWLLGRGMRTLFARVEKQSRTALALAQRLAAKQIHVDYPGLPSHPQHAIANRQMKDGYGGMLSIRVKDPLGLVKKLKVWTPATSLGGVESLIEHRHTVEGPTSPTPFELLRLSCGLEHPDDLFEDLVQAL